ncbi:MAG: acyl-CoA dehydrogenase [Deltaproteobacteria bacterium HGW-Deltaproteobacteria-13]|jgi:alkylation response protein AidB-like acyl-CoA dehydrogenase|nr:MAG: acyl-CoA dehydrogenase [Deltaproteobacteria bacterium HGW-Deltaproteobacteria-13]
MEDREFGFSMSEEQCSMKDTVAKLVKSMVSGNPSHDMDEARALPREIIDKVWELGATVSMVPEEYGGYGMEYSPIMNTIVLEELACGDMALAIAATLPSTFIYTILEMGTEEQKKKYLSLYCDPAYKACTVALNEPRFKFDAVSLETKAEKKDGKYILNGRKCFVPLAKDSGHLLVAAAADSKMELFIVEGNNPGLKIGEREKNLGLYALESYPVVLENCEVSVDDRVGGEKGCDYSRFLQKSRIAMSALGTGVSRASFEYARDYAKERVQFGEPIASRQAIAFMIAEMAYEVDAMRLMTWKAASALEAGRDAKKESYLAKLYAGEMTMKITDYGVQILGGHGFIRENPVERYYRNGRGIAILEGMAMV